MSKTTSLALRLDAKGMPFPIALEKQESIPNAETVEAFKWTENYIKSGKKKGVKTPKDLFK